jgi:hypothetical protein
MTAINYNKLRLNTDSPFIKGTFPNPLVRGHLDWMTIVSNAMQGSCGDGNISDTKGNVVGRYKAFGGLVICTMHIAPETIGATQTTTIRMPSSPFNRAPVFFSDGTMKWGSKVDNIWTVEITFNSELDGQCNYWS